jgi:hypothetical protein
VPVWAPPDVPGAIAAWLIEIRYLRVAASPDVVSIRRVDGLTMKDNQDRLSGKTGADVKDSRRDRLKLALRENLKRRKSQARGRSDAGASSETADASLDDAGGEEP